MAAGSKWSDEVRDEALDLIREGVAYREISRRTGVAPAVLSRWAKDADVTPPRAEHVQAAVAATQVKWEQRRSQLADLLGLVAAELVEKARKAPARDAQAFMTGAAIGIDKAQLVSGGATSRHEQLDAERRRERILAMQDELTERRAQKDGTTGG